MPQPLRVDVGSATAFTGAYWAGEPRGTGSAGVGGAKDTTNRTEVSAGGADFGSSSVRPNACRAPRGARGGRVPSSCMGRAGGEQAGGSLFLEWKDHYFLILKRFCTGKGVFLFVNPRMKGCKEGVLLLWLSAAMGFVRPRVCCSDLHTITKTSLGEPAPGECPQEREKSSDFSLG